MSNSFKIRTITYFLGRVCSCEREWGDELAKAAAFLRQAEAAYLQAGYEVQTVRVVTRALSAAASAGEAAATAALLEGLCLAHDLTFLNLGDTSDEQLLADGVFSQIAACTNYTSCSFSWRPGMGQQQACQLAAAIHDVAERTAGAGNFRFGVGFNCRPGIPYFPTAVVPPGQGCSFAIGTENSALLHQAFQQAAAAPAGDAAAAAAAAAVAAAARVVANNTTGGGSSILGAAQRCLRDVMAAALQPVQALALQLAVSSQVPFLGIDASIAPALEPPTIPASYELLGLGRFGGAGTLAISECITAALKSLPIQLCGYSGLMLPVCEDGGLAEAASQGRITISSLLHFSAVCGCGLDTVPVPGATQHQLPEERQPLLDATAAVLLDTAALALRLDKPLSVRLLPVPGGRAGQQTAFDSPYLINCKMMALD